MKNRNIESGIMRLVWSSVETTNSKTLLQLSDQDLIHQIMRQVEKALTLTSEDRKTLMDYISSKTLLIRDMAESQG
jgi:hypothetical protein